jgi:3-methylfumaryl-CoA hydratase
MDQLGEDGHPRRGDFLPPVPLPRRMWAGGSVRIIDRLRVGDTVQRRSRIADVALKQGSGGMLCFVAVDHEFSTGRGKAIEERQDIVYREAGPTRRTATTAKAAPAQRVAERSVSHMADPVLLFRYSALTFNGHRIHYDRPYATGVEGYGGLVVHGPLQASLMLEAAADLRGGAAPAEFRYRGVRPLFDGVFSVNAGAFSGSSVDLWIADGAGEPTMTATAQW